MIDRKLTINDEIEQLLGELRPEEFRQLEENILRDGVIEEPIVIWRDTIIDGHNRYRIANKHGIDFRVSVKDFKSRREALEWIATNQLGRRNLTSAKISYLRSKAYENSCKSQAATAEELDVSPRQLKHDVARTKTVDKLAAPIKSKHLSGARMLKPAVMKKLSELPEDKQLAAVAEVESGEEPDLEHAVGIKTPQGDEAWQTQSPPAVPVQGQGHQEGDRSDLRDNRGQGLLERALPHASKAPATDS